MAAIFTVTIYSPADKRENVFGCESVEDLDKSVMVLTAMMESGSWFKVEKK